MANLFLRFDPQIEGGSVDDKFVKQIVVQSFSWGETNDGTGAVAQDFHFTADTDKQSPRLLQACAEGTPFNFAELNMVNEQTGQAFYTIKMTNVLISSYQVGASTGGAPRPIDQASLRMRVIDNSFRAQKPDGSLDAPIVGHFDFGKPK
jgi:type VI protein secretion system component Hcp